MSLRAQPSFHFSLYSTFLASLLFVPTLSAEVVVNHFGAGDSAGRMFEIAAGDVDGDGAGELLGSIPGGSWGNGSVVALDAITGEKVLQLKAPNAVSKYWGDGVSYLSRTNPLIAVKSRRTQNCTSVCTAGYRGRVDVFDTTGKLKWSALGAYDHDYFGTAVALISENVVAISAPGGWSYARGGVNARIQLHNAKSGALIRTIKAPSFAYGFGEHIEPDGNGGFVTTAKGGRGVFHLKADGKIYANYISSSLRLGNSIKALGDFYGTGKDYYAVGASDEGSNYYVLILEHDVSRSSFTLKGTLHNKQSGFGMSLELLSSGDLAIGSYLEHNAARGNQAYAGALHLVKRGTNKISQTLRGLTSQANFGRKVADLGKGMLAVGAPGSRGRVTIYDMTDDVFRFGYSCDANYRRVTGSKLQAVKANKNVHVGGELSISGTGAVPNSTISLFAEIYWSDYHFGVNPFGPGDCRFALDPSRMNLIQRINVDANGNWSYTRSVPIDPLLVPWVPETRIIGLNHKGETYLGLTEEIHLKTLESQGN